MVTKIEFSVKDKDRSTFWRKYDPIVKDRVYKMIEQKDCAGLQKEFKITADNMDKFRQVVAMLKGI